MNKLNLYHFYMRLGVYQSYNQFIYLLQRLPLLGNYLSNKTYRGQTSKSILFVVGLIYLVIKTILSRLAYLVVIWGMATYLVSKTQSWFQTGFTVSQTVVLLLLFFSLVLASFVKGDLISPGNRDNTLAIKVFHLPARDFLLAKEMLDQIFWFFTYGFFLSIAFRLLDLPILGAWSLTSLILGFRLLITFVNLHLLCPGHLNPTRRQVWLASISIILSLVFSVAIYFWELTFIITWSISFITLVFGLFLTGMFTYFLWKSFLIEGLARQFLTITTLKNLENASPEMAGMAIKEKDYDLDIQVALGQTQRTDRGITYLNRIFYERFSTHFKKKIRLRQGVMVSLFLVINLVIYYTSPSDSTGLTESFLRLAFAISLPIGYFLYSSEHYTKFCFYHMDRQLLKYSFYRQPEYVLESLKIRFKSLVRLHSSLLGLVLIGGLVTYGFLGGRFLGEVLGFVGIELLIMLFFSFHHLLLYYLLQPFTVSMTTKSLPYTIINWILYMFSFQLIGLIEKMSPLGFMILIFGMVVYVCGGIWAAIRYAPKRFKLR